MQPTQFLKTLESNYTRKEHNKCSCKNITTKYETDDQGEKYSFTACDDCGKQISSISYTANETLTHDNDSHQDDCNTEDQYTNYNRPYKRNKSRYRRIKIENHYFTIRAENIEFLGNFSEEIKELVTDHRDQLSLDITYSIREFFEICGIY